ncbi:MAG: thiamine phosphate synthase [Nonlabens sp.]|uniref:thiamine phosphate synthase n=1 Tax=Nonlabens sp. TaxID=1888209 RepID=UPI003219F639
MIPKLHFVSKAKTVALHVENIQKACSSGIEAVQLDMEHILKRDKLKLAQDVIKITSHFQTRLFIKADYKLAIEIKADGVYLDQNDASPTLVRKHLFAWQSIGATAYTLEDCQELIAKEVDYIGLGPFKISESDNNQLVALGYNGYTAITDILETETPILGFGKVTTNDVKGILETGVSGLLVSEAIRSDFSSIKEFHKLLNAGSSMEMQHKF